ncbi:TetR/AcrR family transcriptional regulator [Nocardiopsis mangrovi]|uniref:TetR/AcrR family transcriptional regulator n=1 Tax=Nocardiopsis mangrovi TaxID=1179818 RepID=A0ABV9E5M1_9ACTN
METRTGERADGRVLRGDHTRRAVLRRAVDLASVEGLDGLSIGRLAKELEISKSGLFAHFGAKEELQLAAIRAARRIYADVVVAPALEAPPGLARIWALSESWFGYSRSRVFPGGCFFARVGHEFGARTGRVHDALASASREWLELIERSAEDARRSGELAAGTDPAQLAFEVNAFFDAAGTASLLHADDAAYDRARDAVRARLRAAAAPGAVLPWTG